MYLKDRSNRAGSCWPGIKTIARDMNLSRSTVKRALADLEQHGYLAKLPPVSPQWEQHLPSLYAEINEKWIVQRPGTIHFIKPKNKNRYAKGQLYLFAEPRRGSI